MDPKEFFDLMYGEIEDQHETVDDLVRTLERFNPVMAKARIGELINRWHQMRNVTLEHLSLSESDFRGLVEHISNTYDSSGLYKPYADPQSNVTLSVNFTRAFAEESRGTLYYATVMLSESAIPGLKGQNREHYLISAMTHAVESLEKATTLSSDAVLAKGLLEGAKQYQQHLQQES